MPATKGSSETWWKIKKAMEFLNKSEEMFARYNMDMATDQDLYNELSNIQESIKLLQQVETFICGDMAADKVIKDLNK